MTETQPQPAPRRHGVARSLIRRASTISWSDLVQAAWPIVLLGVAAVVLTVYFVRPAPPSRLTIGTGPRGSQYETTARRYRDILARSGIKLAIVETDGSLDNLRRLSASRPGIDIALVQTGTAPDENTTDLTSLGSLFYQPVLIFYRAAQPMQRLSQISGRIAIGAEGSGNHALAQAMLRANGIEDSATTRLLNLEGEAARRALLRGEVEAIFLSGDSASPATIREMLHAPGIRLFDFTRADAYVRRFPFLNKLPVPRGAFDLGEDLPPQDIELVAPTVELVARPNLHPVLVDLLIQAAREVNGRATVLQSAGQFPNTTNPGFPVNDEAARYYKSGDKSLTYRYLPFWLASLVNRILVVLVPVAVVLIPGLRFLPQLYNWRITRRIHNCYAELMAVERASLRTREPEQRSQLRERLEHIEHKVIGLKIPGSHAELAYQLREHIEIARKNLGQ